jgi:hypothetical protein
MNEIDNPEQDDGQVAPKTSLGPEPALEDVWEFGEKPNLKLVKGEGKKTAKKKLTWEASREECIELIEMVLGEVRKDLFTNRLLCRNHFTENKWESAKNYKGNVKSYAKEFSRENRSKNFGAEYSLESVDVHLDHLQAERKREMLFHIPIWDGIDRVEQMVNCFKLSEKCPFNHKQAVQLVKDWLAKMWDRLTNPKIRNRILLITGPQEVGKDWWIETLVSGLDRWQNSLQIKKGGDDKDMYRQLCDNGVLKIPEYNKSNTLAVETIKDMITRFDAELRKPYAEDPEQRQCRVSFISSCNLQDVLKDPTGASRYAIIDIESIDFSYPNTADDSSQILAQAAHLSSEGYKASPMVEDILKRLLKSLTPQSTDELIVADWYEESEKLKEQIGFSSLESQIIRDYNVIPCSACKRTLQDIAKRFSVSLQRVFQILKVADLRVEAGHKKIVSYKVRPADCGLSRDADLECDPQSDPQF